MTRRNRWSIDGSRSCDGLSYDFGFDTSVDLGVGDGVINPINLGLSVDKDSLVLLILAVEDDGPKVHQGGTDKQ